jgi:hypothetical protein
MLLQMNRILEIDFWRKSLIWISERLFTQKDNRKSKKKSTSATTIWKTFLRFTLKSKQNARLT